VYPGCCGGSLTPLRSCQVGSLSSSLGVLNEDTRNGADAREDVHQRSAEAEP